MNDEQTDYEILIQSDFIEELESRESECSPGESIDISDMLDAHLHAAAFGMTLSIKNGQSKEGLLADTVARLSVVLDAHLLMSETEGATKQ